MAHTETKQLKTATGESFYPTVETGTDAGIPYDGAAGASLASTVNAHTANTSNPHGVTKAQLGLSNVDNKSEAQLQADFEELFAKQDGAYENLFAGNLITDQNWSWVNDFVFGTGTVDTVFDGEATLKAIKGRTEWDGTTPAYVNVESNTSVFFNLYNSTTGYAHVVKSDNENNGVCVYGEGITTSNKLEFSTSSSFSSTQDLNISSATNSTGVSYLKATIPSDGYVRLKGGNAPEDFCIANVWGGNRVTNHPEYSAETVTINTKQYFPSDTSDGYEKGGMKSIAINGEEVVYDEMQANKYWKRVAAYAFGATPSIAYQAASGTYNIYRMALTSALNKGACVIGGSTKFAWTDIGQMTASTPISADCMSLYTGYIYFALAQSEDTTYTYAVDSTVVDAETFASELEDKGHLFTESEGVYTEATEYTEGATYYYISATDLHGLNGKAITDEIKNKIINYQILAMTASGTTISPARSWTYRMGDFGTEELTLTSGFTAVPDWVVYYPINVVETVQHLPNNYVSLESAENLLHQVGDLQGFDFDNISVDEETGNMKVNGLVDTKETIIELDTNWDTTKTTGHRGILSVNDTDILLRIMMTSRLTPRKSVVITFVNYFYGVSYTNMYYKDYSNIVIPFRKSNTTMGFLYLYVSSGEYAFI